MYKIPKWMVFLFPSAAPFLFTLVSFIFSLDWGNFHFIRVTFSKFCFARLFLLHLINGGAFRWFFEFLVLLSPLTHD